MNKKLIIVFSILFISIAANAVENIQCFDAKNKEQVYKVMYQCYQEVPKVNSSGTTAYPECSAVRLCYINNKIIKNPKGNVCIEDYKKLYTGCRPNTAE